MTFPFLIIQFKKSVKYDRNYVVIRTNGGNLTVKAPADTVKHYGEANVVDIQEVAATSYHEYGDVLTAKIAKGRLVITEEAEIGLIKAVATNDVFTDIKIGLVGNAELPTVTRDDVALDNKTEAGHYTQLVLEVQKLASETTAPTASNTEYVWIEIDIDGSNNKTTKTEVSSSKTELTESTKIQDAAISNSVTEITKVSNETELRNAIADKAKYILLLNSFECTNQVEINCTTVIDGDGFTLTSTGTTSAKQSGYDNSGYGFYHGVLDIIAPNVDVKITNIDLKNNRASGTGVALSAAATHVNVEIENISISAKYNGIYTHVCSSYQNVTVKYVEFDPAYGAVYWRGSNGKFIAYNTTFTSENTSAGESNSFNTFSVEVPLKINNEMVQASGNEFVFETCKFKKAQYGTALQSLMKIGSENNIVRFNNTEFEDSGIIMVANTIELNGVETPMQKSKIYVDGKEESPINTGYLFMKDQGAYWGDAINITSGTFSFDVSLVKNESKSIIKDGYHAQNNGNGTWTVVAD